MSPSALPGGPAVGAAEVGYDQITAAVNIVSTTEATGTTIIACAPHTFNGFPVLLAVFLEQVLLPNAASANFVAISLFEGATQIGRLANITGGTTGLGISVPVLAQYRFTPTAAAHTYTITAHASSTTGTPLVNAGAGGVATRLPSFARFTQV